MKYDHAKPLIERLMHVAVLYHASSGMLRTKIFDALKEFIPDMDDGCFERGCPAIDHFSSHTTTRDDELKEMVEKGTKAWADTPDDWVDELRGWEEKREWVGLATGEAREFYESDLSREELIHKIDEFLQEKNT